MTPLENPPAPSLEALSQKVDTGFALIDERFAQVDERFARVDENFARIDADLRELRVAIGGIQKTLLVAAGSLIGTLVLGVISALIALGS